MSLPRFHVAGAGPGSRIALPEHAAHHAREVLRLRAGSPVRIFDGEGAEFEATLDSVTRQGVLARLGGPIPPRCPESPLRVVLALPPLKGDRMETVIQKATELGVAEIRPVVTARTANRLPSSTCTPGVPGSSSLARTVRVVVGAWPWVSKGR